MASAIVCLFLVYDIAWAYPDSGQSAKMDTLARWLVTRSLMESDVKDPVELDLEVKAGMEYIAKGWAVHTVNAMITEAASKEQSEPQIEFLSYVLGKDGMILARFRPVSNKEKVFEVFRDTNGQIGPAREMINGAPERVEESTGSVAFAVTSPHGSFSATAVSGSIPATELEKYMSGKNLINSLFEGGGAKGVAYAGVLEELESRNMWFKEIAGTSAGAITAALIAVGYTAPEIKKIIFDTDFNQFKDRRWGFVPPVLNLLLFGGLYRGKVFEGWISEKLKAKLGFEPTLKDLPIPLTVIASDITSKDMLVLNRATAPDLKVSTAVRMSMGIPFFFEVYRWDGQYKQFPRIVRRVVDGGVMSNFPLFIYNEAERRGERVAGFMLDETPSHKKGLKELMSKVLSSFNYIFEYTPVLNTGVEVVETMWLGHDKSRIENDVRARIVTIPVDIGTLDFDLTLTQKEKEAAHGREATKQMLDSALKGKKAEIQDEVIVPVSKNTTLFTLSGNMPSTTPTNTQTTSESRFTENAIGLWQTLNANEEDSPGVIAQRERMKAMLISDPDTCVVSYGTGGAMDIEAEKIPQKIRMLSGKKIDAETALTIVTTIALLGENVKNHAGNRGILFVSLDKKTGRLYVAVMDAGKGFPVDNKGAALIHFKKDGKFEQDPLNRPGHGVGLRWICSHAADLSIYSKGCIWRKSTNEVTPEERLEGLKGALAVATITIPALGSGVAPSEVNFNRLEKTLFAESANEKSLLARSAEYLGVVPVNEHVDISAIPKDDEQFANNMKTLARLIAWNNAFGLNVRYIFDNDPVGRAQAMIKWELTEGDVGKISSINNKELLSRLGAPYTGDGVIDVYLADIDTIKKMNRLSNNEYAVALKDDPKVPGVSIPNYTAASAIGLSLAALRIAKEKEEAGEYERLRRKIFGMISNIYARFKIVKDGERFVIEDLEFMVTGCSKNKLDYAVRYALPPIVKDLAGTILKCHEILRLVLRAA